MFFFIWRDSLNYIADNTLSTLFSPDPYLGGRLADEAVDGLNVEVVLEGGRDLEPSHDLHEGGVGLERGEAVPEALPHSQAEGREGAGGDLLVGEKP